MEAKAIADCIICGEKVEYYKSAYRGRKKRFCSQQCYSKVKVVNLGRRFTGRRHTPETIEKIKQVWSTKIHPFWKGSRASYQSIHVWVRRHKGAPQKCEHCGYKKRDRLYEWANVSGKYLRDLNDYKRVCQPCHRKYYDNAGRKVRHGHFVN